MREHEMRDNALAQALHEIAVTARRGLSFGYQATPQTQERMVDRKDEALRAVVTLCEQSGISGSVLRECPPQVVIEPGDVIEFAHGDDAPMLQRLTHQAAVEDWNGKLRDRVRAVYTPKVRQWR